MTRTITRNGRTTAIGLCIVLAIAGIASIGQAVGWWRLW